MGVIRLLPLLWRLGLVSAGDGHVVQEVIRDTSPDVTFSREWQILGPFQLGTREIAWSTDPLEWQGGFHSLDYDANATFRTPLLFNGTTTWSTQDATLDYDDGNDVTTAKLTVSFPDVEWQFLRDTYGWAVDQWQAWARGGIYVHGDIADVPFVLSTDQVLEYWIDDVHYFGGDFYGYRKAPVTLRLSKGEHRFDVKLVREVRSMGGPKNPDITVGFELRKSRNVLVRTDPEFDEGVLISNVVGEDAEGDHFGQLVSPYAAVTVRNDAEENIYIHGIRGMHDLCILELLSHTDLKLVPGQSRPVGFRVACVPSYDRRIEAHLLYHFEGDDTEHLMRLGVWPDVYESQRVPHRVTYIAPGGMVSYTILRPPSLEACGGQTNRSLPVMINLHGAGLEADDEIVRNALLGLPDLCAWILFPTGVTPWSGDDWHVWGNADMEAAIAVIPRWIERVDWSGPGVDIDRWLVTGHSNGGQGVWYVLTHHPDKIIAAAAVSGYSSIQNYVPYVWWHTMDPHREAVVQSALLNYRHELLLENAQGIPVIQQHGSADDNVPPYNSRLLAQRISQAGASSTYHEFLGKPHYWDGVMTTQPLSDFFNEHLDIANGAERTFSKKPSDFTLAVANAGEMGSKNGVRVLKMRVPGRLSKIHFTYEASSLKCDFDTVNVLAFRLQPGLYAACDRFVVDGEKFARTADGRGMTFTRDRDSWNADTRAPSGPDEERSHELGGMDAILRSLGAFSVVSHSSGIDHVALQISRNLCQYYAADTVVGMNFSEALNTTGNIITVAIGSDLPRNPFGQPDIAVDKHGASIISNGEEYHWSAERHSGLAAIFLRPLSGRRLELVVWGVDAKALETSARLVPLLTGGGQPDFIVTDSTMLWKGVEGTLALGFFDWEWKVSGNSYIGS